MEILKYLFRLITISVFSYIPMNMVVALLSDLSLFDEKTDSAFQVFLVIFIGLTTIDFIKEKTYNRVLNYINSFRGRHKGASKTKLA